MNQDRGQQRGQEAQLHFTGLGGVFDALAACFSISSGHFLQSSWASSTLLCNQKDPFHSWDVNKTKVKKKKRPWEVLQETGSARGKWVERWQSFQKATFILFLYYFLNFFACYSGSVCVWVGWRVDCKTIDLSI